MIFSTFLGFSLLLATRANAQQSTAPAGNDFRAGIGVALNVGNSPDVEPSGLPSNAQLVNIPVAPITVLVPMRFSNFKIEPEVGIYNFSYNISAPKDSTGTAVDYAYAFRSTGIQIGAGFYYTEQLAGNLSAYFGPRAGIITYSTEFDNYAPAADSEYGETSSTVESSRTDFYVGVTLGGEYFFSNAFSLGADVGFEYLSLGTESNTITPVVNGTQTATTGHSLITKGAIVARVYF